jgi:hypothetical protein
MTWRHDFFHTDTARVDVDGFDVTGGDVPVLSVRDGNTEVNLIPHRFGDAPINDEHVRFAHELVDAAEQYRDSIEGARFWADFDQPPPDAEGVA